MRLIRALLFHIWEFFIVGFTMAFVTVTAVIVFAWYLIGETASKSKSRIKSFLSGKNPK